MNISRRSWRYGAVALSTLPALLLSTGCARREKAIPVAAPTHVYREPTFDEVVADGADGSVEQAKSVYNITLDYKPDSVKKVDGILTKLHGEYLKDRTNKRWRLEGLGWGAYVGEVIRRQYGGHWDKQDGATGNPLPLIWHNGTSFPVTWSINEIIYGGGQSIYKRYQEVTSPEYTRAFSAVKKA